MYSAYTSGSPGVALVNNRYVSTSGTAVNATKVSAQGFILDGLSDSEIDSFVNTSSVNAP
jgi:hypothetical protein